jgi:two-component system response regulator DctR
MIRQALALEPVWFARLERQASLRESYARLTPQQRRVLPMVTAGMLNKVIADKLSLSVRAIEEHRAKVFDRLGVGSAAELATLLAEMRAAGLDLNDGEVQPVASQG